MNQQTNGIPLNTTAEKRSGLALASLILGICGIALCLGPLAAVAIPNFVKARNQAQYNACQSNLRMIQGAKEMWALENKRTENDVPADTDLFGAGKMIKIAPACPAGGHYSLNPVKENPTCTVHDTIRRR